MRRLALVAALLLAPLARPADAGCHCARRPLDLVFVVDRSGSMEDEINFVYQELANLVAAVAPRVTELRIGFVTYSGDVRSVDLTSDRDAILRFIAGVQVGGGFEPVDLAIEHATSNLSWNPASRRVMVLIGDEPPNDYQVGGRTVDGIARAVEMSREASRRGIIVHAVSTNDVSEEQITIPVEIVRRRMEAQDRYQRACEHATREERLRAWADYQAELAAIMRVLRPPAESGSRDLRLSSFIEIARVGGGTAIHLPDTSRLLPHLVEFSLGYAIEPPKDEGSVEQALAEGSLVLGLLALDPAAPPRAFSALAHDLEARLGVHAFPGAAPLDPRAPNTWTGTGPGALASYPLLYATGHDDFDLPDEAVRALRRHLDAGGVLFGEACCSREPFAAAFRRLVDRLYPGESLAALPATHPIYHVLHDVPAGPDSALLAVEDGGALRVIFSPVDLGCEMESEGEPCMAHDPGNAFRLLENVVAYTLTR